MAINKRRLNYYPVDGKPGTIAPIYMVGNLAGFTQNVSNIISGNLIAFAQDVEFQATFSSTNLIALAQAVETVVSGNLISFQQQVESTATTFYQRNGYDVYLYINGNLVDSSTICDKMVVKRDEGSASTLTFSLKPPVGAIDVDSYTGAKCFVNIRTADGIYRIFTGWIDNPHVDLIMQRVEFSCSDRRKAQIMAMNYGIVSNIGYFSKYVSGTPKDQYDELSERLTTVPYSFDFDVYSNPTFTSWTPKSTADIEFDDGEVYYEAPKITYEKRDSKVNSATYIIRYTHERLQVQNCDVQWSGWQSFSDWYNEGQPSFPKRTAISSAASSGSWVPTTAINFTPLWPAGGYSGVVWQPNQVTNNYVPKTISVPAVYYATSLSSPSLIWPDGFKHSVVEDVLDSKGNPIMQLASQTIVDTSSPLCIGANWSASKKLTQSVTELYSLTFECPEAVSKYGKIDYSQNISFNDPYDSSFWLRSKDVAQYNSTPGTAVGMLINATGTLKGSNVLTVPSGGTGSINPGNQIGIVGDPSGLVYTIVQGLSSIAAGGTIKISPGLGAQLAAVDYNVTLLPGVYSNTQNVAIDMKPNYNQLPNVFTTVTAKAKTLLKKSYRDVSVNFRKFIYPQVDLYHTVQLDTTRLACYGKVKAITHTIDINTTESYTDVTLLLTRLSSSYTNDSAINITYPPYEDMSYINDPQDVVLQTHVGINPSVAITPTAVTWNGYVGNKNLASPSQTPNRTTYPESFTVDYPPIPITITEPRTITAQTPGANSGVTTTNAGFTSGSTSIAFSAGGTGQFFQGDTVTFTGDGSSGVYTVLNDVLDVSAGGVLNISPGIGATFGATHYPIVTHSSPYVFNVKVASDPLTVDFINV